MIKTKFVVLSEKRFFESDRLAVKMAIESLYKDDIKIKDVYIEERTVD